MELGRILAKCLVLRRKISNCQIRTYDFFAKKMIFLLFLSCISPVIMILYEYDERVERAIVCSIVFSTTNINIERKIS